MGIVLGESLRNRILKTTTGTVSVYLRVQLHGFLNCLAVGLSSKLDEDDLRFVMPAYTWHIRQPYFSLSWLPATDRNFIVLYRMVCLMARLWFLKLKHLAVRSEVTLHLRAGALICQACGLIAQHLMVLEWTSHRVARTARRAALKALGLKKLEQQQK